MCLKIEYNFFLLLQTSVIIKMDIMYIMYIMEHDTRRTTQLYDKVWIGWSTCFSLSLPMFWSLTFLLLLLHCYSQSHLVWDHPWFLSNKHKGLSSAVVQWEGCCVAELPTWHAAPFSEERRGPYTAFHPLLQDTAISWKCHHYWIYPTGCLQQVFHVEEMSAQEI